MTKLYNIGPYNTFDPTKHSMWCASCNGEAPCDCAPIECRPPPPAVRYCVHGMDKLYTCPACVVENLTGPMGRSHREDSFVTEKPTIENGGLVNPAKLRASVGEMASEFKTEIKTDVSLFPPAAVRAGALAFMAGQKKGGRWPYNWRNSGGGVRRRTYLAAAMRHIQADLDGEDFDAEMSELLGKPVPHYGAALASLAMLADGVEFGNVIDNRPSTDWEKDQVKK